MTARTCELEFAEPSGMQRNFRGMARNYAASPTKTSDSDGAPRGVVAVFQDITPQRETGRQHAEFVSAVSHEVKTPLASIKAYVELLADGDVTDQATREEFLGVINSQAERLQRLIDNLLNLARIESGVVKVNKECSSLNELLKDVLDVVRPAAEQKRIDLRADLSPMYLAALVDRDQMSQAAINLLSNAIKYTPEGGTVTLRSRIVDDRVQFDVEDSGVGISPEDSERVFQKFYRVNSHTGMAPGTGLGLPLARSIVEEVHGGTLALRSEVGRGSTFTVTLPAAGTIRFRPGLALAE
jgi:two-component system phosphate regulon sensor histidine kinase PhoR